MKLLVSLLAISTLASAITVVAVKHESRKLFVDLQELEKQRDAMMVEWGKLQLEESTLTTQGLVERTAYEQMHMKIPAMQSVVMLHPWQ
ncbi:MAG: cell division protein FtsL [Gammaproteobacteria bacterium]